MNSWVSAKDKLPDQTGDYIIHVSKGYTTIDEYYNGWYFYDGSDGIEVTHWQPLPEKPKENDNE